MTVQFRNLVFEGGGVKGIAYVGAMQVLQQHGALEHITRVGGTSAGAINALAYALGYDIPDLLKIMKSTNFREFMDDSWGVIRDVRRLANHFGWFQGDFFDGWIADLIEKKLGNARATFADLRAAGRPDLYVVGTNLSTRYAEVFSAERHPDMPLATAVRISMSIPLFFAAVRHGARKDVYVDGGVLRNYPIKLFDRERFLDAGEMKAARRTDYYTRQNAEFLLAQPGRSPYVYNCQTLGMRLDSGAEIAQFRYNEPVRGKPIKKFPEYARALIGALMSVQENQHLHGDDWQRSVYIDTLGVGTTDFDLDAATQDALLKSGIDCAEKYFRWFTDPAESPVNRLG